MHHALLIISKVLPVIFLIVFGNLLQRFNFLKQATLDDFKKIIINFSIPSLLFITFSEAKIESRYMLIFPVVFVSWVFMLFSALFLKKVFNSKNRYFPTLFLTSEAGMFGYPLYLAVYGSSEIYKLAIVDLGQAFFFYIVLVSYIIKLNGKSLGTKQLLINFAKSPVIISIIIGVFAGVTGVINPIKQFPVSNSILETLKLISNLTVPMICIAIGYELHFNFKTIGKPLLVVVTRIFILAALAFLISTYVLGGMLHLDKTFKIALSSLFILPVSFTVPIFIKGSTEDDKQFILNTISVSIILSLISFMILISIT